MKQYFTLVRFFILILVCFLTVSCNKSHATRELPMTTTSLAKESNDIVVAKCISSEAKKDDKTGFIFTYTTFEIEESLKEKYKDGNLVLRTIGGQVGDMKVNVSDMPEFVENEEVVLFLGPVNTEGYPVLQSFTRGVYKIKEDESGKKVVATPISGLNLFRDNTKEKVSQGDTVFLNDFLYSLSQIIN